MSSSPPLQDFPRFTIRIINFRSSSVSLRRPSGGVRQRTAFKCRSEGHEGPGPCPSRPVFDLRSFSCFVLRQEVKAKADGCNGHISDRRLLLQFLSQPRQGLEPLAPVSGGGNPQQALNFNFSPTIKGARG